MLLPVLLPKSVIVDDITLYILLLRLSFYILIAVTVNIKARI